MSKASSHGAQKTAVIGGKAGVINHKKVYTSFFAAGNDWHELQRYDQEYSIPQSCEFNKEGDYLAVAYESGHVDIWAFKPIPFFVRTFVLSDETVAKQDSNINQNVYSWRCSSVSWSLDGESIAVAHCCPDSDSLDEGMVVLWSTRDFVVRNIYFLPSPVTNVTFSPTNKHKCLVSLYDGQIWCIDTTKENEGNRLIHAPSENLTNKNEKEVKLIIKTYTSRAIWRADGKAIYVLTAGGSLKLISTDTDNYEIYASTELMGATISTLQLTPDGKYVLVGANKGVFLIPADTLDIEEAQRFGEIVGLGNRSNRGYWTVGCVGNLSGNSSFPEKATVFFVPNAKTFESREINWWVTNSPIQINNRQVIRCPGDHGLNIMTIHPSRALMVVVSTAGKIYMREEYFRTDFAGPMYPPGYRLLNKNTYMDEAEDQFDILVTIAENGEEVHTRAHEYNPPGAGEIVLNEEQQNSLILDIFTMPKEYVAPNLIIMPEKLNWKDNGDSKDVFQQEDEFESKKRKGVMQLLPLQPPRKKIETNQERYERRKSAVAKYVCSSNK